MDQPLVVQAEYSFMGSNNDELCFQKGDVITVTQREDGGWWEGTLNDKTGWFPSNYVNECKVQLPLTETIRPPEEIQEYRSVVLKDLLDSERAHVAELQGLLENFLEPMQQTQILSQDEYAQLMCNFVEIVRTHEDLLIQIEECNDRVGKLFLTSAPLMKKVHQAYCAAHPKAIVILDKYKDELEKYMERQGAATPGLLVLTTGLSKPFRRLDKYSAMLQELERHMESSHPDRGDTQRSVAVYKDIAATCSATRRQKELELQVLTGPVRGWQGQELSTLGDIIHMGSVAVGADHRDRYFVLFPQTLLFLSVSQRMSAFIYEGKLPLTGIIVNRLEDTDALKNAFEISSPLIDRIVAVCQGPNEANKWVELLNANNPSLPMGIKRQLSNLSNSSLGHLNAAHLSQHLDSRGYCTRFSLCAYYSSPPCHVRPLRVTLPPSNYPATAPYANLSAHFARLVKGGGLRSAIVKMLLYPQARQSIDLKRIALRKKRCHKASAKLKDLNANQDSGQSELERQDAIELPTDSESYDDDFEDDFLHSCDSDPFEYVQFYQNKRNDSMCNSTGTFVDHGTGARRHCSSINLIKLDSADTDEVLALNELKKESLVIGSRALRALARKSTTRNSSVHTSTATLELGVGGSITSCVEEEPILKVKPSFSLQQQSSDASSIFAARLGGAFTACENLASMPDDLSRESSVQEPPTPLPASPTERHSMPTIFVGNRFNHSKNTEVYVPTWRDRQEMQNQSVDAMQDEELHSSSIDLPAACLSAPDKLQAELLYNYDEILEKPLQLHRELTPFPGHNLNSDKRVSHKSDSPSTGNPKTDPNLATRSSSTTELCIDTTSKKRTTPPERSRDSIRRCISYQFLQMSNRPPPPPPPRRDPDLHLDTKCRCCENSQCPSPRSSDSGMAGSCTITSPDPPNPESYFPMEATGHDMLDNVEPESSSMDETNRNIPPNNILFSSSSADQLEPQATFRSGMYAHWWKKERLPPEVVRGIAHAYNKSLPSKDSKDSGSVCSSCFCSLGASGYSEGALYCSVCQNCADYYNGSVTSTTNTTTTTSSASCPLCSEDEGMIAPTHDSSSLDCPICTGRIASGAEEGKQSEMDRRPGNLRIPVEWSPGYLAGGVCSVHVLRLIVL
ncbi:GD24253 [Drosophila simulans]|uniref:GD24253 n=1 Tax=Drosophila simulans TaxID=7240 RepID=B4QAJ0_DROSI|nr:GD24253 [Drosophila simulans]